MKHKFKYSWNILAGLLTSIFLFVSPSNMALANVGGYANYEDPGDQMYVVMPEITGGWFAATDFFPDNGNGDTIGKYQTAGRALVANHKYIYLQKNYGIGAGSGTWTPGEDNGVAGDNLPGGHENWIIVAEVTPGVGESTDVSMDPSFIHISPDGTMVALGMGYNQPLLVFPISMLDPDSPPLLNSGNKGETPASGVTLFPWGDSPDDGVQYYEAEWIPDPNYNLATLTDNTLDPAAETNNTFLAINTDRGWSSDDYAGEGSQIELLDISSSANRPVITIQKIGYSPSYSASADLAVDNYGNLITGQGYDYNNPDPTSGNSQTGQIKIFGVDEWMGAYDSSVNDNTALDYNNTTNIIADNILSAAALGVDKDNNLHVGGGDVVSGKVGETGFTAVIHADALEHALDNLGAINEADSTVYQELQPDSYGDDSATFTVYNPWAGAIVVIWNPTNATTDPGTPYDGWYEGVQPIATSYYNGHQPDSDSDGIPDGSDNAYLTANPGQEDTDGDGWADIVDADFNNSNTVNYQDYLQFRANYGSSGGDSVFDMNSDGRVNYSDYLKFRGLYGTSAPWY